MTPRPQHEGPLRARTAVVVIDVQNDFFHPQGAFARQGIDVGPQQRIIPTVQRILSDAEAVGIPRIFVVTEHGPWFDDPAWVARGRTGSSIDVTREPITVAGTWGARCYQVTPSEHDLLIVKHRHSAFVYTPLELALRANGLDVVCFVGATTNVCVRSSAMDALARGFHPVLVSDALAAPDADQHHTALSEFGRYGGQVATRRALTDSWRPGDQE